MELFFFLLLLLVLLLPPLILYYQVKISTDDNVLKDYPIFGTLPQFIKNRHRFLDWQADLLAASPTNSIQIRRPGGVRGVITANPANVEHVLKTRFENYPKGPLNFSILHDFLGNGIFNADGHVWRAQRKTASFEFNTRSLRIFVVEIVQKEIAFSLIPLFRRAENLRREVDFQDVMERFAFDNVCHVAFSEDPEEEASLTFGVAFKDAATVVGDRFRYFIPKLWKMKRFLNVGSEKRLREAISKVDDFAFNIIRSRKKEKNTSAHEDLLSRFMQSEENSDRFLRDVIISFILAGRDTTSSALTWFFWNLSRRPDVEDQILEEIRAVRERNKVDRDKPFGFEDLKEMNYLHAALSESMRLYPPVPLNSAYCCADDVLPDGTKAQKGGFVAYNSYAMGRMRTIWGEDCCEFKPDRWLTGGEFQPESPFRYPIFHAGPRICLGKEMAYIQMKSVAANLIENFKVEVLGDGARPEINAAITLKMKHGMPVIIRGRAPLE